MRFRLLNFLTLFSFFIFLLLLCRGHFYCLPFQFHYSWQHFFPMRRQLYIFYRNFLFLCLLFLLTCSHFFMLSTFRFAHKKKFNISCYLIFFCSFCFALLFSLFSGIFFLVFILLVLVFPFLVKKNKILFFSLFPLAASAKKVSINNLLWFLFIKNSLNIILCLCMSQGWEEKKHIFSEWRKASSKWKKQKGINVCM